MYTIIKSYLNVGYKSELTEIVSIKSEHSISVVYCRSTFKVEKTTIFADEILVVDKD